MKRLTPIIFTLFAFWAGTGFRGVPPDKVVEHRLEPVTDMSMYSNWFSYSILDQNTKKVNKYYSHLSDRPFEFFGDVNKEENSYITYKTSLYWPWDYGYALHTTENKARFLLR